MYWDFRVIRKVYGKRDQNDKLIEPDHENNLTSYGIHEVYYDDNDRACMCSKDPVMPAGDTVKEMIGFWYQMREAFKKPIIDYDSIPEEGAVNEITESLKELEDEDGNRKSTEELIEEGKLIPMEDVMSDLREKYDLDDFDLKEYRNEEAVERTKTERQYNEKLVNKSDKELMKEIMSNYGFGE